MSDVDAETRVWISSAKGGNSGERKLHTNQDCHLLGYAKRPTETERGQYPHLEICRHCSGEREVSKRGSGLFERVSDPEFGPEDLGLGGDA